MRPTLGDLQGTQRGFGVLEFVDYYDLPCSLQVSSLALDGGAVWLGTNKANPGITVGDAQRLKLDLPIPIDEDRDWSVPLG